MFCLLLFVIIDHKLTLQNIVKVIDSQGFPASEAHRLGLHLGIRSHKVQDLAADNRDDCHSLLSGIIDYWLNNNLQQSWQVLADAVGACGYPVMANTLCGEQASQSQVRRRLVEGML